MFSSLKIKLSEPVKSHLGPCVPRRSSATSVTSSPSGSFALSVPSDFSVPRVPSASAAPPLLRDYSVHPALCLVFGKASLGRIRL